MTTPSSGLARFGKSQVRVEDQRFLTGQGHYIDDVNLPRQAYAAFVRSPHAHARVRGIDTAAAAAMPGVVLIVTGAEWAQPLAKAANRAAFMYVVSVADSKIAVPPA